VLSNFGGLSEVLLNVLPRLPGDLTLHFSTDLSFDGLMSGRSFGLINCELFIL